MCGSRRTDLSAAQLPDWPGARPCQRLQRAEDMRNRLITATPWNLLFCLLTVGFCSGALLAAQGTTPAASNPAQAPAPVVTPVTYPRMANEVVTQLLDRAAFRKSDEVQPGTIIGPNEHLTISSARVLIAEKNVQVVDAGGSYTPPANMR